MRRSMIILFVTPFLVVAAVVSIPATRADETRGTGIPVVSPTPEIPGSRCFRVSWPKRGKRKRTKAQIDEIAGQVPRCGRVATAIRDADRNRYNPPPVLPNQVPTIALFTPLDGLEIVTNLGGLYAPAVRERRITVTAIGSDPDGDTLFYTFTSTGGKVNVNDRQAVWDLSGVVPSTYTILVEADDGCGCVSFASASVTIPRPGQ